MWLIYFSQLLFASLLKTC